MNIKLPFSKYVCQKCKTNFERSNPGPVFCPQCNYNYIDWINAEEVLKVIWKEWERRDGIKRC